MFEHSTVACQQMLLMPPEFLNIPNLDIKCQPCIPFCKSMLHVYNLSLVCVRSVHVTLSSAKGTAVPMRLCQAGDTVSQSSACFAGR